MRAAVAALERAFGTLRCSTVYRSVAVGASAPDYLNLAVAFDCRLGADAVKSALIETEAALGRTREGPRSSLCAIDLDLLIHGRRVDAQRRLPHPDVLRRAFVLAPLAELAPELFIPSRASRSRAREGGSRPRCPRSRPSGGSKRSRKRGVGRALPAHAAAAVDRDDLTRDVRSVADEE